MSKQTKELPSRRFADSVEVCVQPSVANDGMLHRRIPPLFFLRLQDFGRSNYRVNRMAHSDSRDYSACHASPISPYCGLQPRRALSSDEQGACLSPSSFVLENVLSAGGSGRRTAGDPFASKLRPALAGGGVYAKFGGNFPGSRRH